MSRGSCKISIVVEGAVLSTTTLLKETEDFYYEQTE